jgi:putative hydrolase of the HAD superfamily
MIDSGLRMQKEKAIELMYLLYRRKGLEDQHIFEKFLRRAEGRIDYRKLAYGIVAYRRARAGFMHPYPGAKETLIRLKETGLRLAVVTDAPRLQAWMRLAEMGIDDFFDAVVALEDTGRVKPSRLPFRAALKALSVRPEECIFVGDRPDKDMKGARQLGMKTCFARYGFAGKEPKGKWDLEISRFSEIAEVVKAQKKQ